MSTPTTRRAGVRGRLARAGAGLALRAVVGLVLAPVSLAADPSAAPSTVPSHSPSTAPSTTPSTSPVTAASGSPSTTPNTPIQHLVVLMQENHTFDNYFGTYPGADGIPPGVCMPNDVADATAGCVKSHHLTSHRTIDLNHGADVAKVVANNGTYNGFVYAQHRRNLPG